MKEKRSGLTPWLIFVCPVPQQHHTQIWHTCKLTSPSSCVCAAGWCVAVARSALCDRGCNPASSLGHDPSPYTNTKLPLDVCAHVKVVVCMMRSVHLSGQSSRLLSSLSLDRSMSLLSLLNLSRLLLSNSSSLSPIGQSGLKQDRLE